MERSRGGTTRRWSATAAIIVGFLVGLVVSWIYWRGREVDQEPEEEGFVETERLPLEELAVVPPEVGAAAIAPEPDDLKRVEGIGPKISQVLQSAGILSFRQLAETRPAELRKVLGAEDERLGRLADPTTWPEQASLAAVGAWDALRDLQDELSAGRRKT